MIGLFSIQKERVSLSGGVLRRKETLILPSPGKGWVVVVRLVGGGCGYGCVGAEDCGCVDDVGGVYGGGGGNGCGGGYGFAGVVFVLVFTFVVVVLVVLEWC